MTKNLQRRLRALEAMPPSAASLVAEVHRLDAVILAGGELPAGPSSLSRTALPIVAAAHAFEALMPGGGAAEEQAVLARAATTSSSHLEGQA